MALIVQKYGGSSLADVSKLKVVAEKIVKAKRQGNKLVVVVSAMGKTTDRLISLAGEITDVPPEREMDLLLATGEMVSVAALCMAIEVFGESAEGFPGYFAGIKTDSFHTRARIQTIEPARIVDELKKESIVVVAGFQGLSPESMITTLGRGGSDLTAIAIAAALKADKCEIYTDVDGVFTSDPNRVPGARLISEISYDEMLEMASTGANVMLSRAVEFAKKYEVPFYVKSTFNEGDGTMVKELSVKEGAVVSAVSIDDKQARISIFGIPDSPGVASRVFLAMGKENINVDMIVQNSGKSSMADISFTVNTTDLDKALKIAEAVGRDLSAEKVVADREISKISIIGIGMMNHPGVAGDLFNTLSGAGVNIQMISTSEIKISCVVAKKEGEKALRAVHKAFLEGSAPVS